LTRRLLLASFFLFLLSFPSVFSALRAEDTGILLMGNVQLRIADAFMEEGEYYRAITEFKKYLILFPDSGRADYASFSIGMAYYKGEEFRAAARSFSSMRERYPGSAHALPARYYEGFSRWKLKEYEEARRTLEALAEDYPESAYAPRALVASSLVALDEDKPDISRAGLERFVDRYPGHPGAGNVKEALALLERYQDLPHKSPGLAGFMSAVLPGSGYMYAEHYGDGVTAFLINGLFIAGAVAGFHQENYAVGTIVAGIGLPFYVGNIYGSANAAKKWNLGVRNDCIEKIHLTLSPLFEP